MSQEVTSVGVVDKMFRNRFRYNFSNQKDLLKHSMIVIMKLCVQETKIYLNCGQFAHKQIT